MLIYLVLYNLGVLIEESLIQLMSSSFGCQWRDTEELVEKRGHDRSLMVLFGEDGGESSCGEDCGGN
jgi:hypothetical protein